MSDTIESARWVSSYIYLITSFFGPFLLIFTGSIIVALIALLVLYGIGWAVAGFMVSED